MSAAKCCILHLKEPLCLKIPGAISFIGDMHLLVSRVFILNQVYLNPAGEHATEEKKAIAL